MRLGSTHQEITARLAVLLLALVSCGRVRTTAQVATTPVTPAEPELSRDCELALLPRPDGHDGEGIAELQQRARTSASPTETLEQLGWSFVSRARITLDPSYYAQAEACARCISGRTPDSPEALLLQAYILENQHRFHEAETLARQLTGRREFAFDFGLLGDALMEQGRIANAAVSYQKMMDLRPGLEAYSRAAHLRWLTGDLDGAIELMELAVSAGGRRNPEPVAWVEAQLARYEWQRGRDEVALRHLHAALALVPDYPPALYLQGRVLLAQGAVEPARGSLEKAANASPLPEYQWALLDAIEEGKGDGAQNAESKLLQLGQKEDARSFALFLATRFRDDPKLTARALDLAQRELDTRQDVFTHDALGWALAARGHWAEAYAQAQQALAAGTQDARLFLHAAAIAAHSEHPQQAAEWGAKAAALRRLLLPSERRLLPMPGITLARTAR